jgi:hypothetical protein
VWWPAIKNSPKVASACLKRRLKWVPGAWGYNWATLRPGDVNTEAWSSRLGVRRGSDNPTLLNIIVRKPETTQASGGTGVQRQQGAIKELGIGTRNVLALYEGGAMRNLDIVLQKYRMNITAIQEIGWLGQGIL